MGQGLTALAEGIYPQVLQTLYRPTTLQALNTNSCCRENSLICLLSLNPQSSPSLFL